MNLKNILPDSTELLLIKALCMPENDFRKYWTLWRKRVDDYNDLDDASLSLFSFAYKRIKLFFPDDSFKKVTENAHKFFWIRNNLLGNTVSRDLKALSKERIPFLILKGGALIPLFYNKDFGVRSLEDIDVFVSRRNFNIAILCLQNKGWRIDEWQNIKTFDTDFYHAITLCKGQLKIDLHCHAFASYLNDDDWKLFVEDAKSFDFFGSKFLTLNPSDHLVHFIVHGLHFNKSGKYRWIVDAVTIINSGRVDWERVYLVSKKTGSSIAVYEGLKYLKHTFKLNIPTTTLTKIKNTSTSFAQRRNFAIGLKDINDKMFAALEYYFWIYMNSVHGVPFKQKLSKLKKFMKYLSTQDEGTYVPQSLLKKTVQIMYRSLRFK